MSNDTKNSPSRSLVMPENAASLVRSALKVPADQSLRISYLSGTGDVVGTYGYWIEGIHDPRVPVLTYSAMFYELASRLGAEAQVITPWKGPAGETFVKFVTIARDRSGSKLQRFWNALKYVRRCVDAVDHFNPHVVIVDSDCSPLGWRSLKRHRKLVLSAHNTFWPMGRPPSNLSSRIRRQVVAFQSEAVDGAVCTSAECKRQIAEVTRSRVVGEVEFPQVAESFDPVAPTHARRLLFLGRIEADKGIFLLLDAFLGLPQDVRQKLSLTFAGSGTASEELAGRLRQSADPNISFLGRLDAQGVHNAIARSDLVVCPTTTAFNEGLALVGFEAAAHGIPSLLSSVVPAAEALGDGCLVFEADNLGALRDAITLLATDADRYARLQTALSDVRPKLSDRSLSWGTQLYSVLTSL